MHAQLTTTVAFAAAVAGAPGLGRERAQIPDKYKWKLEDLFPSEGAWLEAQRDAARRTEQVGRHRGHLGDSAPSLLAALDGVFALSNDVSKLTVYASCLSSQDTREARPRELVQTAQRLRTELSAATSWLRPELLALDPAKVRGFLRDEPRLAPYHFFLEDVLRWKPHTLTAAEERVAAQAGEMHAAGGSIHNLLVNADLPYPVVRLSTGEEVRLDPSAFTLHRAARSREDRSNVFAAFLGAFKTYERTLGAALAAHVKAELFDARLHRFDSVLDASLFRDQIPPAVYRQLLSDVHRSLPALHRYLALRKRMLALPELAYQDLYAPLVESADLKFEPEEARDLTLQALAPLGQAYVDGLRAGFESGWTDFLPSTGKRSGAFSTGVYGVHPFQLLNFNGRYVDLSTLAHESGHSMHTFLANQAQPLPTADYSIFVAEVASTLNENLLLHHMLRRAKDDATRLFLLGTHLDSLRTTLFRQAQFAEFELAFYEKAQKGEALTGENLSALYLKITRDYYGHDKGACRVDDLVSTEWAFIHHFYGAYYVYQYATSLVASTALARSVREEGASGKATARRDAFLRLLQAGGSKYPIDLLREAGVDMTTSAPFDAAIAEMNATMDEIERILARQPAGAPAKAK